MDKELREKVKELKKQYKPSSGDYRVIRNCLLILRIINDGYKVNQNDLAEICGNVSTRTIARYLKTLREVGYEISYNHHYRCYELVNKDNVNLDYLYQKKGAE